MTGTTSPPMSERDEIELLLPWYVTGRLDAADRIRVERAIAVDASLARQLALIEADRQATIAVNEAIRPRASLTLEAGMAAAVPAPAPGTGPVARVLSGGVAGAIRGLFEAPTPAGVRWAAAAALTVVLVQATVIGVLTSGGRVAPGGYQTASGEAGGGAAGGAFALVKFVDRAAIEDVSAALVALDMAIVAGPKPGGLYKVRIGNNDLSAAARGARIDALRSRRDVVVLSTPAP